MRSIEFPSPFVSWGLAFVIVFNLVITIILLECWKCESVTFVVSATVEVSCFVSNIIFGVIVFGINTSTAYAIDGFAFYYINSSIWLFSVAYGAILLLRWRSFSCLVEQFKDRNYSNIATAFKRRLVFWAVYLFFLYTFFYKVFNDEHGTVLFLLSIFLPPGIYFFSSSLSCLFVLWRGRDAAT